MSAQAMYVGDAEARFYIKALQATGYVSGSLNNWHFRSLNGFVFSNNKRGFRRVLGSNYKCCRASLIFHDVSTLYHLLIFYKKC